MRKSSNKNVLLYFGFAVIPLVIVTPSIARASDSLHNNFICQIENIYSLDNGRLKNMNDHPWNKDSLPSKFTVDRKSGAIIGDYVTTVLAVKTIVTDHGLGDNSFNSIALFDNNRSQQIQIKTWEASSNFSFVVLGLDTYTGRCSYL